MSSAPSAARPARAPRPQTVPVDPARPAAELLLLPAAALVLALAARDAPAFLGRLTADDGPPATLWALLRALGAGALVLLPSFGYLYAVLNRADRPAPHA